MSRRAAVCGALIGVVSSVAPGLAQPGPESPISADRPGESSSAVVVPRGQVQIETGYRVSDEDEETRYDVGEITVRWGLTRIVELRGELNSYQVIDRGGPDDPRGFEDPALGVKLALPGEPGGWRPRMAVLASVSVPVGAQGIGGDLVQPTATWAADWSLSSMLGLTGNLTYEWAADDRTRFHQVTGAGSLSIGLGDRWSTFVELYARNRVAPGGRSVVFGDGGIGFALTRTLILDAHFGYGFRQDAPERWGGVGLSVRL